MENDACESLFFRLLFFAEDAPHIFPRASSFLYIERLIVLFIKNKMRVIWFIITQAFRLKSYICFTKLRKECNLLEMSVG